MGVAGDSDEDFVIFWKLIGDEGEQKEENDWLEHNRYLTMNDNVYKLYSINQITTALILIRVLQKPFLLALLPLFRTLENLTAPPPTPATR